MMYLVIIDMANCQQSILGIVVVMVNMMCNAGLFLLEEMQFQVSGGLMVF